jgi:hypothetical protein
MQFSTDFHGTHWMNLEDVWIAGGIKARIIKSTPQKAADRNPLANRLIEAQQPRRSIVKPADNMRLKRLDSNAEL